MSGLFTKKANQISETTVDHDAVQFHSVHSEDGLYAPCLLQGSWAVCLFVSPAECHETTSRSFSSSEMGLSSKGFVM